MNRDEVGMSALVYVCLASSPVAAFIAGLAARDGDYVLCALLIAHALGFMFQAYAVRSLIVASIARRAAFDALRDARGDRGPR